MQAPAVPETYALKPFTIGEGDAAEQVEIDTALLETATPVFKDAGLNQAQVDKLAPLALELEKRFAERQSEAFETVKTEWATAVKSDPEIGGKNLPQTMTNVAKALDYLGYPSAKDADGNETNEFRRFCNDTGIGNHPTFVRMFDKIGKAVGEDGALPRGDRGAASKRSAAEVLYPDDIPKKQGV